MKSEQRCLHSPEITQTFSIYLVETGLPFNCIKCLQIMNKQRPLEVGEGLHANRSPGITAQPSNPCGSDIEWSCDEDTDMNINCMTELKQKSERKLNVWKKENGT